MRSVRVVIGVLLVVTTFIAWWGRRAETPLRPPIEDVIEPEAQPTRRPAGGDEEVPDDDPADSDEQISFEGPGYWDQEVEATPVWSGPVPVRVVADDSGAPVAGAEILARIKYPDHLDEDEKAAPLTQRAVTDAEGRAEIPRCSATVVWGVHAAGFRTAWPEVEYRVSSVEVRLDAVPAVRGIVLDAATRAPIADARVRAMWVDEPWSAADIERVTGADGRFVLGGIDEGQPLEIAAVRDGFGTVVVEHTPTSDRSVDLEILLGKGVDVVGTVRDAAGNALVGADVFVAPVGATPPTRTPRHDAERTMFRRTRTIADGTGSYAIRGVAAPASFFVYARHEDVGEGRSGLVAAPDSGVRHSVDVTVAVLGKIVVTLADAEEKTAIPGHLWRASLDIDWGHHRPDQEFDQEGEEVRGWFRDVVPGIHVIYADASRYLEPAPVSVEVEAGQTVAVDVPVEIGGVVTGRVIDETGHPLSVYVTFDATYKGVEQYPNARSGDDGRFVLRGIPPVVGTLRAFQNGVGEKEWAGVTPQGDLGDLVIGKPTGLVLTLPAEARASDVSFGVLGRFSAGGRPDEDGRITIDVGRPNQAATVFVRVDGRPPLVIRDLVLGEGELRDLGEISFPEPHPVAGRVLSADDGPVEYALVRTVEWWGEETRTDALGRFRLEVLPPGRSVLWVEHETGVVSFHPIDVVADMDSVDVHLPAPGTLRCTLVDDEGVALASAPVNLFPLLDTDAPDWSRRRIVRTDGRGVLECQLTPGVYGLEPHASTGREVVGDPPSIEIDARNTTEITVEID